MSYGHAHEILAATGRKSPAAELRAAVRELETWVDANPNHRGLRQMYRDFKACLRDLDGFLAELPDLETAATPQARSITGVKYLISMTPEDAKRLEGMLGGRIEIVPSQGAEGETTGAVISGLDAVTAEEARPIQERLATGGPMYHAGGPGSGTRAP